MRRISNAKNGEGDTRDCQTTVGSSSSTTKVKEVLTKLSHLQM